MDLAKILLPVHDRLPVDDLAAAAFALAARFHADVEGLYASEPPINQYLAYGEGGIGVQSVTLIEEARKQAAEAKRRAKQRFEKLAHEHPGVATRFLAMEGSISDCVARRARLADITVIGAIPEEDLAYPAEVRDGAIFHSGRPVLVVPPHLPAGAVGEAIIVAWKDSMEAARAVAAARPLIAKAKSVRIVSAGRDAASPDALEEVQRYVSHYNKKVKTAIISKDDPESAKLLLAEAAGHPGALLVMGAYSHWRIREWILGGVTDYVLRHTTVPVLLAH